MAKNIRDLKEAIYSKLNTDTGIGSFNELVGENFYSASAPTQAEQFPRVSYQIITDDDYKNDDQTGQVSTSEIDFIIEDNSTTTEKSDNIESRINILINGNGSLTTADIICYTCVRQGIRSQRYVPEVNLQETIVSYIVTWAPK